MLCEICNKNEATVHITKVINGVKEEKHVCENCAGSVEGIDLVKDMNFAPALNFQNVISGFLNFMNQGSTSLPQDRLSRLVCENCGTTYDEFMKTGLLGCDHCYSIFNDAVMPVLRRVQTSTEHHGKIPTRAGKDIAKEKQLETLKKDLQKAIEAEEFEKAAELRDKIRDINKDSNDN